MALLMPQGKHQYFTTAGEPLVGGKVYTYAAGTSTLLTTYSAQSGAPGTENTNPVVLDARGEATIFFGAAGYKVVLRDALDNIIWTQDNLFPNSVLETFTITDDLTFTGTGNRILGDFSNATNTNRVLFKSSTTNGNTSVGAIPNGTSGTAAFIAYSATDPDNSSLMAISIRGDLSESRFASTKVGTGAYLPIAFLTSDLERLRIDTSGNVLMKSAALLGYGTGAGGAVTQAASKSTAVTLDKPCGQITMNGAELAAGTSVTFLVNNNLVGSNSVVYANGSYIFNSPTDYAISVLGCDSGAFRVKVTNTTAGPLSEEVIINFIVFNVVTS